MITPETKNILIIKISELNDTICNTKKQLRKKNLDDEYKFLLKKSFNYHSSVKIFLDEMIYKNIFNDIYYNNVMNNAFEFLEISQKFSDMFYYASSERVKFFYNICNCLKDMSSELLAIQPELSVY